MEIIDNRKQKQDENTLIKQGDIILIGDTLCIFARVEGDKFNAIVFSDGNRYFNPTSNSQISITDEWFSGHTVTRVKAKVIIED